MGEAEIDQLFEVKPAQFVAARDALAKQLRADDRGDEASDVRKMRRPPVVVWALNQLARRDQVAVDALLAAGEAVREAQRQGSGARLRDARDELQSHVSALTRQGVDLLESEEVSGPARAGELETALRGAALSGDPDGALRVGRLHEVPEAPSGPEIWAAGQATAVGTPKATEEQSRELDRAVDRQRQAEEDLERAQGRANRLAGRVRELEDRLDQERIALRQANTEVNDAKRTSRQAAREVSRLRTRGDRTSKTARR